MHHSMPLQDTEEEAFKSKGYRDVDVFKVTQTLPVCKGTIYQSIGCILIALFSAAAGYATLGTGLLPKWTGWVAYAAAVLNFVAVPIGLSIAPVAVLTVAIIADFPLQIWLLIVSILMIRKREANAETLRVRELKEAL